MFRLIIISIINIFYQKFSIRVPFSISLKVAEQDYEKKKLNERIGKISGGLTIIQVKFGMVKFILVVCNNFVLLVLKQLEFS